MKKALSMLLVVLLTLSMSTMAFAATPQDNVNPTFEVVYQLTDALKVEGQYPEGLKAPAQTFTYSITADKVEQTTIAQDQIPLISAVQVAFEDNETPTTAKPSVKKTATIDLTSVKWPNVGVYYYKITQSVSNPALGVNYSKADHTLKVTVYRDSETSQPYVALVTYA